MASLWPDSEDSTNVAYMCHEKHNTEQKCQSAMMIYMSLYQEQQYYQK